MMVGMLATQAVAEGAATVNRQSSAKPETESVPSGAQTEQISLATTANLPLVTEDSANADLAALPDAPATPDTATESASVNMPLDLRAAMQNATQNTQSGQTTPSQTKPKHPIHPGWLAVSAVGVLLAYVGGVGLGGSKNKGLAAGCLVTGVALAGGGIYLTFR
jgi:hypothetical protein